MKYNPIEEEIKWWNDKKIGGKTDNNASLRHNFAHSCVRSKLYDALMALGCNNRSIILELGCGSGEDAIYTKKASKNIVGVDIARTPLKRFVSKGFQGVLADVKNLPFHSNTFDYVIISGLLHHLIGQGNLKEFLNEFARVTQKGGYVIALEPNVFNLSGFLMNIFNTIKPGIAGLVPH